MNFLIINGSPRKKGLISQMLGIMQEEAEKRDDTVEMVYTNGLTVKTIERGGTAKHRELTEKDKQKCRKAMERL